MKQAEKQQEQDAKDLFNTMRGKYILGQALYLAIQELEKVPNPYREKSNIEDMKLLQSIFFPYALVAAVQKTAKGNEKEWKNEVPRDVL